MLAVRFDQNNSYEMIIDGYRARKINEMRT